ncbi:MAG: hypothetical protein ACTSV5_05885 [Promethearchaeota archaeon]
MPTQEAQKQATSLWVNTVESVSVKQASQEVDLYRGLDASICKCPGCNQTDRDMMYNAFLEE